MAAVLQRRVPWLIFVFVVVLTYFTFTHLRRPLDFPPPPEGPPPGPPLGDYPGRYGEGAQPPVAEQWSFDVDRDERNYGMTDEQCDIAFPGLFQELERAKKFLELSNRTISEADAQPDKKSEYGGRQHGEFHCMIYDGELYVIKERKGEPDRSRGLAALANMYRALASYANPKDIPNIEFTFDIEDVAQTAEHKPDRMRWAWARHKHQPYLWVMPDFDGWSYPDDGVASYVQFRDNVRMLEAEYATNNGWEAKEPKLSWRGSLAVNGALRGDLVNAASDHPWNDVQAIDWHDHSNILDMHDFCRYQYVAHTEGNSWSGRLRYLHNCESVPVIHELDWVAHYYSLLEKDGPNQNYVEVKRDWSDLAEKMDALIQNPERAKAIAAQNTKTFRDRYLTPAAEACYWRRMFKTWHSLQDFEPQMFRNKSGTLVRRGVSWERFAFRQKESFEHGFYEEDKVEEEEEE